MKTSGKGPPQMAEHADARFILRLYVTGGTPHSTRAIINIRRICENHFRANYDLDVVDIAQQPSLAQSQQIIATPTLIKEAPLPPRRFIGDLSDTDRILKGLGLPQPCDPLPYPPAR